MSITYLVGAGASANALPTVTGLGNRMSKQIDLLKRGDFPLGEDCPNIPEIVNHTSFSTIRANYITSLEWLISQCESHASIDTYAKKLFLRQELQQLHQLKTTLAVFFTIEQLFHTFDLRYDSFFASILNTNFRDFPSGMKIVSWNYDFQFEQCFKSLSDAELPVISKGEIIPRNVHTNDLFLYKLNGSSKVHLSTSSSNSSKYLCDFTKGLTVDQLKEVFQYYHWASMRNSGCKSGISFAWESHEFTDFVMNEVKKTETLVVVGYSFPFFNREVDRKIIKGMASLRKVYFQSPDADSLATRFSAIQANPDIVRQLIHETGQFYLPDEL